MADKLPPSPHKLSLALRSIAEAVEDWGREYGGPDTHFVLVYATNYQKEEGAAVQYISDVERSDGADILRTLIKRWDEGAPHIPAHENPDIKGPGA